MTDRDLVEWLIDIEEGLTDWEVRFVESIARQVLDKHRPLTPKQRATAQRIAEEKG